MISAIITTIDSLPNNKEQVRILRNEPLIDEIIVVNNGSIDNTKEWLSRQNDLTVINKENNGAGPGRNAGLDKAGQFDYVLMLDGGIRPLAGGVKQMLDYLEAHIEADLIGVEIPDFETDYDKAWRRWPNPIEHAYRNTRLSHTAYCLARYRVFDGIRFKSDGPFGEPGWGADDDEMAYQWNDADIAIYVVSCRCNYNESCTGVHPYHHPGGSFRRLYRETGIWPNQFGSVYEKRLVWLQQNYPHHEPGVQWGEPWLTVVIENPALELIKEAHDELRKRRFKPPFDTSWNPYRIIAWGNRPEFEARRLRQHHGNKTIICGEITNRSKDNEASWTGDFIIYEGDNWQDAIRPNAHYYGLVSDEDGLMDLIEKYNQLYPPQKTKVAPEVRRQQIG